MSLALVGLSAWLGSFGCGNAVETTAVYEERIPISADDPRGFAYRVTAFQFGSEIGGYVEFYELDGLRNTRDRPYAGTPHSCSYFGAASLRDESFNIDTLGVTSELFMRVDRDNNGRELVAEVIQFGGTLDDPEAWEGGSWIARFDLAEDAAAPNSCPRTLTDTGR